MAKAIDMTGLQCGDWYVIERAGSDKRGQALWHCRCVCGTEKNIVGSTLRNGTSTNCGCIKAQKSRENNGTFVDEVGNRYGKLVVLEKDEELSITKHRAHWLCKCDCGNFKIVSSKCLRDGKTKSCGCILSAGEEETARLLYKYNQKFISQYGVLIGDKYYRFDFAVLENNEIKCLIEYHGIQHYDNSRLYWGKDTEEIRKRDAIKEKWAHDNGIRLYVVPYTEFDNLEEIIKDISKNN